MQISLNIIDILSLHILFFIVTKCTTIINPMKK